jgi:hypothetical protein
VDADETLASEARRRPRAAAAALAAALLILGGYLVAGLVFSDRPTASLLSAIEQAAAPGPIGEVQSLQVPYFQYYSDRTSGLIGGAVLRGLGFLLAGLALAFLAQATRSRSESFPRFALYLPLVGGILSAISFVLAPIGSAVGVNEFLDGPRTVESAEDIGRNSLLLAAQFIGLPGSLALSLAFVLVALNAMRAGLLTRFMGVLGILAGALFILPIGSELPVVQCFWLAGLGVLFLGRWPGGEPPAWRTGRAEPWPTQQELRESRDRARAGGGGGGKGSPAKTRPARDEVAPAAVAAGGTPHPVSNKRKRKRRT